MIFKSVIIILLVILVSGVIYNTIILRKLKNNKGSGNSLMKDERYFDLKYRLQLFASVGTLVLFFLGFLGLDTKENLENNFNQEFDKISEKVFILDSLLRNKQTTATEINNQLDQLAKKQRILSANINISEDLLDKLQSETKYIEEILSRNQVYSRIKFRISSRQLNQYFSQNYTLINHRYPIRVNIEDCINIDTGDLVQNVTLPPSLVITKTNNSDISLLVNTISDKFFNIDCVIRDKIDYLEKFGFRNYYFADDLSYALQAETYSIFRERLSRYEPETSIIKEEYSVSYSFSKDLEVEAVLIRNTRQFGN